jgi:hypothetical protein
MTARPTSRSIPKVKTTTRLPKENVSSQGGGSVSFELNKVSLNNTTVNYTDQAADQQHTFKSTNLVASIQTIKDIYNIEASGELTTEKSSYITNLSLRERPSRSKASSSTTT